MHTFYSSEKDYEIYLINEEWFIAEVTPTIVIYRLCAE